MTVLADARWPECEPTATLVVPVGATEQHGPHLPLGTDTVIASEVCAGAGRADPTLTVAPAVAYGASGEHETFPGTVSIGTETLAAVLIELGRSACRFTRRLVFVNGHGGNHGALRTAVPLLRAEGRDVAWFPCGIGAVDAHAGRYETSVMLALGAPVRIDLAEAGNTAPLRELLPTITTSSVREVSPNGVLGDPTGASAPEGAESLAITVAAVTTAIAGWAVDERTGRLR